MRHNVFQQCNFSLSETNQMIIFVSLEKKRLNNPLHELTPVSLIQHFYELSSGWAWGKSQIKAKREILKKQDAKNIHHREKADQTYIDMMLGMKLLQAATESGYPQSWACLNRHADSLCCWAPLFKPPSSRHTVLVTRVTPN